MTKIKLIGILICWQLLIMFWVKMGTYVPQVNKNLGTVWQENFEGKSFIEISNRGYTDKEWHLFPMYSYAIATLARLIEDRVLSGIILSLSGVGIAMWYLIKLMQTYENENTVITTIITYLLFPTSFFLGAIYSEGLLLMWIMLTFYYAKMRKWPLVGLFGMFASYTHLFGLFLLPAMLVECWQNKKNKRDLLWILLILLGFWFYTSYVGLASGDYFKFFPYKSDQIIVWYQIIWRYLKTLYLFDPIKIFELVTGVIFGIITIAAFWRTRLSYALFGFLVYFTPTLSGTFVSLPRLILASFGSFVLIGRFLSHRPFLKWCIWGIEFILLGMFTLLFSRGYWIA